ncbi:dUTP diphosphatase [Pleionea litopenaei]|uniref:dUTP diphosphatase n=1 Tax=Pleionea litopenaei TaxID=3070815 RepID=A0AA51X584_9GAMM|nr:dUTP diphosphatase [Pleionea sp. HL-JVS1]WMS85702.1 dUTP diphosphatase [Pleionea sp. HL-JVS1]
MTQNDITVPLATMVEMQDAMNRKVHPQWFEQNFAWFRAIWLECGEMLDHYGWKWWKHQTPDLEQVKMELVDIFHFGLSCRINGVDSPTEIAKQLAAEMAEPKAADSFPETLEILAATALTTRGFDAHAFAGCMLKIDMDFAELYRSYVGKNTLNFFRQDYGYKEGHYQKVWDGREDNEHLVEVLASLDIADPDYQKKVYQGLVERYPSE